MTKPYRSGASLIEVISTLERAVSPSPDSNCVASLSTYEVIAWNAKGGEKLAVVQLERLRNDSPVLFSGGGDRIIVESGQHGFGALWEGPRPLYLWGDWPF